MGFLFWGGEVKGSEVERSFECNPRPPKESRERWCACVSAHFTTAFTTDRMTGTIFRIELREREIQSKRRKRNG